MFGNQEYLGTPNGLPRPENDFGSGTNNGSGFNCGPEKPDPDLSFDCLGGCENLIEEVKTRILFPIHNPEFVESHGQAPPKGILLHGPPGTGKTLFAKCLASELSKLEGQKFNFFMRRGSDVMSMWVGSSEKNLREVFREAVRRKPSIIFFDEIDALAPNRNSLQGAIPVYVNVVTTMLVEMDKLKSGEVIVICATNRVDAVDPALKRPGRCDVVLQFHPPGELGRRQILELCTRKWRSSIPNQQLLDMLVSRTNGFTGADLSKLCSEAFFSCIKRNTKDTQGRVTRVSTAETVTEQDWVEALQATTASASNVFGSYVQILQPSHCVQPLLKTVSKNLGNILEAHLPPSSSESDSSTSSYTTGASHDAKCDGPNCFLAWTPIKNDENILDSLVVPAALQHLVNVTTYELSERTMLQEYKHLSINAVIDIVTQAKEHPKATILFIPGIDKLALRLTHELPLLRNLLFKTASTKTLVLATAGCPIRNLPTELQPLFDGYSKSYELERPNHQDRLNFFQQVFANCEFEPPRVASASASRSRSSSRKSSEPKRKRPKIDKSSRSSSAGYDDESTLGIVEDIASFTEKDELWSLITLHRELTRTVQRLEFERKPVVEMHKAVKSIITDYKTSRFNNKARPSF